ncbi:hypothetical protein [Serratia sp. OPWLW2]|uniref:hypothetical protein n=1 Tax=Serratia sp. OPWLW2 TaxID=1928658 RepID=UPI000C3EC703|nr:hypothetical protein [Serratia sp. OPWLW2]PIJ42761.1 hypothetical protein BOM25_13550 [Serratia sp. OPWLW2]
MAITEEALSKSGFTTKDIQKLRNNSANYGSTVDVIVSDLAKRFLINVWVTFGVVLVCLIALILGSVDSALSGVFAGLFVLAIGWLTVPAGLAYKSWRFRNQTQ